MLSIYIPPIPEQQEDQHSIPVPIERIMGCLCPREPLGLWRRVKGAVSVELSLTAELVGGGAVTATCRQLSERWQHHPSVRTKTPTISYAFANAHHASLGHCRLTSGVGFLCFDMFALWWHLRGLGVGGIYA
jgi:hypothetical protein